MVNFNDIMETITMIQDENLDIRTITMGISLLDCADSDIDRSCQKIYRKITEKAKDLVSTGAVSYTHLRPCQCQNHRRHQQRSGCTYIPVRTLRDRRGLHAGHTGYC